MSRNSSGNNSGRNHLTQNPQNKDMNRDNDAHNNPCTDRDNEVHNKVDLADMASRLKSLEHQLTTQPEFDQNHVNRIRDAISRGEYHVNPDRIADKMMDFEEDF